MTDETDHLDSAEDWLAASLDLQERVPATPDTYALHAIAHALIAIAERMPRGSSNA